MSGYPNNGAPQQPPYGQIYPQVYVNTFNPNPPPGQPGYGYPCPPVQPPAAMSYPNITPSAPAPAGFTYPGYPNIAPTPVYEPLIDWVATTPEHAHSLSNRALVAGYEGHEGSPLWIIRARFEGDLVPGKLAIKHRVAYVPYNCKENSVRNVEVCCANPNKVKWVQTRDGNIPPSAIAGGHTSAGEPLYIGRAGHQGSLTPGKVHASHKTMYMSFGGQEIPHKVYEILCTV